MVQPANKRLVTEATVAAHVATQITTPGTPTATALNATYAPSAVAKNDPFRYDSTRLRTFRAALAKRDTTPVDILFIGDSITEGQGQSGTSPIAGRRWVDRFRDALRAAWQPAGVTGGFGYVPASWATSGYTNPISYTGTGTSGTQAGSGLGNIRRANGPDVAINKYFTGTGIDIVYMKNSQGTDVTWEIDAGPRTTFNTYAASSVSGQVIQIRGLTPGEHLITLRVVGPNNFYFNGFMEYNGDETKGIRTWAGGRSGYRSLDFVTANERVYEDYGLVNPDLVNIALGTNDYVTSQVINKQTPAQVRANLETLLAAVRAKCTVPPSVVMWLPAEVKGVANALAPWSEYLAAIEALAKADGAITLFDANTLMGDQGADIYGLLSADKIHPNDKGYQALSDSLVALVNSAAGATTNLESLPDKYARVFGVNESYGGGVVDSYSHIQGRLNAAAAAGGGTVVLPPRTFKLMEMLSIPDNVSLTGAGEDSVLDVSGVNMLTAILAKSTTGTKVTNLKIKGSGQGSQPANGAGVVDVRLSGSGIVFAGVAKGLIEGVTVADCGGTTGVAPYNGVAGIWITYGCTDTIVRMNVITNCRNGINEDNYFQADPHGNKIVLNTVRNSRFGIALDSSAAAYDTLVAQNTIEDCQQSGIDLNKVQCARVVDNYIARCGLENGNSGIFLYGTASTPAFDVIVRGNTIIDCAGHGIKSGPYVYYSKIDGNDIVTCAKNGVFIQGINRHYTVTHNTVRGCTLNGYSFFVFSGAVVTSGVVSSNYALSNLQNGFLLDGAAELAVSGNVAKDNGLEVANTYDGFRLTNGSILNTFTGNLSTGGSQRYALAAVDSSTTGNSFAGNRFVAGATGRIAFANMDQHWDNNSDGYITTAGAPTGTFPNGAQVVNSGDQRTYVKHPAGWRYITTTAV